MEDLRKTKLIEIKSLKDLLKKKDILKYVSVQEGFKELFVEVRTKAMREQVVKEVVAFVEDGLIRNISGLEGYFRARIIKERVEKDTADRLK